MNQIKKMDELTEYECFLTTKYNNLNENRGVYDLAHQIVDICYLFVKDNMNLLNYIGQETVHLGNNGVEVYETYTGVFKVPINSESFVINPVIYLKLYVGSKLNESTGSFIMPEITSINNGKLISPIFKVNLFSSRFKEIPYVEFETVMYHEIHHAYRWFKINLVSSNDETELSKKVKYMNIIRDRDKSTIDDIIHDIFYKAFIDFKRVVVEIGGPRVNGNISEKMDRLLELL